MDTSKFDDLQGCLRATGGELVPENSLWYLTPGTCILTI